METISITDINILFAKKGKIMVNEWYDKKSSAEFEASYWIADDPKCPVKITIEQTKHKIHNPYGIMWNLKIIKL